MKFLQTVTEGFFRLAGAKTVKRYAAAKRDRFTSNWTTDNQSANQEIRYYLKNLRARSRQLAKDDDYVIGYLKKLKANVIGHRGIRLQADSKSDTLNKIVEDAFSDWGLKENCTVTGQDSFVDAQLLAVRTLAVDGEFLIRIVADASSEYGFKLQFIDVDWLDEEFNEERLTNGNRVVMSVELDTNDKPVAYWLTRPRWQGFGVGDTPIIPKYTDRLRVPAHQIIHRFIRERVGQVRGVPFVHGAATRLNKLGNYEEAELIGASISASQMMLISAPADDAGSNSGSTDLTFDVAPGQVREIPAGYTVHDFTPNRPGNTYATYIKQVLRAIAVSLGISYNSLSSDLESVNYSSLRAGTIEERDHWKMLQAFVSGHFCQDVYKKFVMFNPGIAPMTKLKAIMKPRWRARGFDWVDPSKDVNASIAAIGAGLKTRTEDLAERGEDFEETMQQLAYEQKYAEKLGLTFVNAFAPAVEPDDDEGKPKSKAKEKKAGS